MSSFNRSLPRKAHSHMTAILQPACSKATMAELSFWRLRWIFASQKSVRVPGSLNKWQSWPCQKQPCMKITALYLGKTMSGFPGRSLTWSRNLNPFLWRRDLIWCSGLVFFPRMPDIILLRVSLSTMSAITGRACQRIPSSASGMPC